MGEESKAPIDRAFAEATMRELASLLKTELPEGVGFVMSFYNFTDDPDARWSTYASNGRREDVIVYLAELAEHLRTGKDAIPMIGVPPPGAGIT